MLRDRFRIRSLAQPNGIRTGVLEPIFEISCQVDERTAANRTEQTLFAPPVEFTIEGTPIERRPVRGSRLWRHKRGSLIDRVQPTDPLVQPVPVNQQLFGIRLAVLKDRDNVFLQTPTGDDLFNQNASNQIGPIILPEAGAYRLLLYGNSSSTGSYAFTLRDAALSVMTCSGSAGSHRTWL